MKFLTVIATTVCFFLSVASARGSHDVPSQESAPEVRVVSAARVGYVDSNKNFVAVDKNQLSKFFTQIGFMDERDELTEYVVVGNGAAQATEQFSLRAKATKPGTTITITMRVGLMKMADEGYAITEDRWCSCVSSDAGSSCDVNNFGPCACYTDKMVVGDCGKTSMRRQGDIASLF